VKPAAFRYVAPRSIEEVVDALADDDESRLIAGGQSLAPMMAFRLVQPSQLIDLKGVATMQRVDVLDDGLAVGGMVTQTALAARKDAHPLTHEAIALIAHPQIRNRGTVCGSLAHADPAAELPAVAVALGARLRARSPSGERLISARDFFTSYLTTVLEPAEVLIAVEVPAPVPGEGWAIDEVVRTHGNFALAGVVARLVADADGIVREVNVVPFAVGERPVASAAAEQILLGAAVSDEVISDVAQAVSAEVEPASDIHGSARYRRQAVAVLTERTLRRAYASRSKGTEA
jgi:carbon-monoxide dehydrogenase medium subunit